MEGQEQAESCSSNEGETLELLETVQNDWRGLKEHPRSAICRVPQTIRVVDPEVYKPRVVSIGPYHHKPADQGHHELEVGQELKQHFLRDFLKRNKDVSLKDYIELIQGLEPEARKHYKEDVSCLSSKEFNKVMLLDGCFMLELLLKKHVRKWVSDYLHYGNHVAINYAHYDLLLVENQLPWFIIDKIYNLFTNKGQRFPYPSLSSLALQSFHFRLTHQFGRINDFREESEGHYCHLLHLIHDHIHSLSRPLDRPITTHVLSASKLHEVGVKFVKPDEGTSLFEISYRDGILELPQLVVTDATKRMFHNFIALEQLYIGLPQYFTTYAGFMRYLITSTKDADVLEKSGLLDWWVGSNEDIAIFFSQFIPGTVIVPENYLSSTYAHLIEHCKVRRHRWIAKLKRDYFGNPWSIISLVAAILLILLTGLQAFFAIFSYFKPPHA